MGSPVAMRIGLVAGLAGLTWLIACSGDITCDTGFNLCGQVCCSTACNKDACSVPAAAPSTASSTGGATTSGSASGGLPPKSAECRSNPTKAWTCSTGCEDLEHDLHNCGACGKVCPDTGGDFPPDCFFGKCQ